MTEDQARAKAIECLRGVKTLKRFLNVISLHKGAPAMVIGGYRFLIEDLIRDEKIPNIQLNDDKYFIFDDDTSCTIKDGHITVGQTSPPRGKPSR